MTRAAKMPNSIYELKTGMFIDLAHINAIAPPAWREDTYAHYFEVYTFFREKPVTVVITPPKHDYTKPSTERQKEQERYEVFREKVYEDLIAAWQEYRGKQHG